MAVYKIFAEKDTTLYSDYPTLNSGMDPILELSKTVSLNYASQSSAARILIKFSDTDISDVINTYITTASYKAFVKLYLANAEGLPTDATVEAHPISGSWDMGTGRFGDIPIPIDGASWLYRKSNSTSAWQTASYSPGVTGVFPQANPGGGNWYTTYSTTQSFGVYTSKDLELDVTNALNAIVSQSIVNEGFVLKVSGSLEFDPNYNFTLNYFGRDTNTVYPPVLEFRWDDSRYNTSGSTYTGVSSPDIRVSLANNKGEFNQYEIHRFRVNVRDQFPVRTYATSSIFTTQKILPATSYYAIKDVKSDTTVIDFDNMYTKISADQLGNYFDIYMYGLEPERYYKILIKTVISGSTLVFDDQYFFKVTE